MRQQPGVQTNRLRPRHHPQIFVQCHLQALVDRVAFVLAALVRQQLHQQAGGGLVVAVGGKQGMQEADGLRCIALRPAQACRVQQHLYMEAVQFLPPRDGPVGVAIIGQVFAAVEGYRGPTGGAVLPSQRGPCLA